MELGIPELVIILVIVVFLWGPGRVAKIGGELGSGIRAFRAGLTGNAEDEADQETAQVTPVVEKTTGEKL